MQYIVFDLEFNQDAPSLRIFDRPKKLCSFEIIQIGALKLDEKFHTIETLIALLNPPSMDKLAPLLQNLLALQPSSLKVQHSFLKFIEIL